MKNGITWEDREKVRTSRIVSTDMFFFKLGTYCSAIFALAAPWLCPSPAKAQLASSPWSVTDQASVRLLSATEAVGATEDVLLGLHFRLKKGWKISWRSPGDAGFSPTLDWSGSENLSAANISWPVPERFSILGFETFGYKDETVLPLTATLAQAGQPLGLRAAVDYLACNEICIPYKATLALRLPAGESRPSAFVHLINRFAVRVPGDGAAHGLTIEKVEARGTKTRPVLRVIATASFPFKAPDLYVEGPDELQFAKPAVRLSDDGNRALLELPVSGIEYFQRDLNGIFLTLTLVDGERSAERRLPVVATAGASPPTTAMPGTDAIAWPLVLVLAVLGGLILNLMPCVLPVLSIKLLHLVGHGGAESRLVRYGFIASAAGILFSFLGLAAVLAALKAAGATVGWGIQFQQPWFLIAMTLVVTLFACNLWGFFELRLPRWIADMGEHSSHVHGLGGHFLSGAFAMLLATPCSAPFLGTAVAFALSRGATEIFAIFAALGLGLALPYLAVAAAPGMATRLPKPGPWMVKLRLVLGFALVATGIWLLTILASLIGGDGAAAIGALMVAAGAALYFRRRARHWLERAGGISIALVAALAVMAFLIPANLPGSPRPGNVKAGDSNGQWIPFDGPAIAALVAGGKVVFVDVTADWCITCMINKALVLTQGRVKERLAGGNVVSMRADWTQPDDAISAYLARFQRYGIPFNAVYGPALPEGFALPELLTEQVVLDALDRAAGNTAVSSRRPLL